MLTFPLGIFFRALFRFEGFGGLASRVVGRGNAARKETEKDENKKRERGEAVCQKPPSREPPKGRRWHETARARSL